jgi:hypothetical protein
MDGNTENGNPPARRLIRPLALLLGAALGLTVVVMLWRAFGSGLPQIHEADLHAARERWQTHSVPSYDMTIVLAGRQTGTLHIEVRDGKPQSLTRNGAALKQPRTWEPWTVPGMFETLETDFDNARHPAAQFGSNEVKVVLRAKFDETYGFPRRYLHQVFGRSMDLTWEVTEFEPR